MGVPSSHALLTLEMIVTSLDIQPKTMQYLTSKCTWSSVLSVFHVNRVHVFGLCVFRIRGVGVGGGGVLYKNLFIDDHIHMMYKKLSSKC